MQQCFNENIPANHNQVFRWRK